MMSPVAIIVRTCARSVENGAPGWNRPVTVRAGGVGLGLGTGLELGAAAAGLCTPAIGAAGPAVPLEQAMSTPTSTRTSPRRAMRRELYPSAAPTASWPAPRPAGRRLTRRAVCRADLRPRAGAPGARE